MKRLKKTEKKTLWFTGITTLCLVVVALFVATGCDKSEPSPINEGNTLQGAKEGRIEINEDEFITMRVSPETASKNSLVCLIIENHTKGVLCYGVRYSLEYFDENNWIPFDWISVIEEKRQVKIIWPLIGIIQYAGEARSYEPMNYYSLIEEADGKKGRYRIIKNFSLTSDLTSGEGFGGFDLCAEFEIE